MKFTKDTDEEKVIVDDEMLRVCVAGVKIIIFVSVPVIAATVTDIIHYLMVMFFYSYVKANKVCVVKVK